MFSAITDADLDRIEADAKSVKKHYPYALSTHAFDGVMAEREASLLRAAEGVAALVAEVRRLREALKCYGHPAGLVDR